MKSFIKFLLLFFILFLLPITVKAEILPDTVYAITPVEITSASLKTGDTLELEVLKTGILSKDIKLTEGDKISVKIVNYVEPKRGKRNGYYNIHYLGYNLMVGTMRVSTPKDLKEIAKNASLSAAGFFLKVPGLTQAFAAAKGLVIPNKNQSRLQSAGENVYKSTPLTYTEKGHDFKVERNGIVVLKLKDIF